jgi:hypothetical protein
MGRGQRAEYERNKKEKNNRAYRRSCNNRHDSDNMYAEYHLLFDVCGDIANEWMN